MSPLTQVVRIGLFIAAAKSEASPEQLQALETTVIKPCSEEHWLKYGEEAPVLLAIREVMGANWTPSSLWTERIAAVSSDR